MGFSGSDGSTEGAEETGGCQRNDTGGPWDTQGTVLCFSSRARVSGCAFSRSLSRAWPAPDWKICSNVARKRICRSYAPRYMRSPGNDRRCIGDGSYRASLCRGWEVLPILAVRDLSSGMQLPALPVEAATAAATIAALQAWFREHGVPLVSKSADGSALTADQVGRFLEQSRAYHLLSPPRLASYNEACEAGTGFLKTWAHHKSARNDRPGE